MTDGPPQPKIAVIIAAAGKGERLGGETPKAWRALAGMSLVERAWRSFCPESLHAAGQSWTIAQIVIAVDESRLAEAEKFASVCPIPLSVVIGGETRTGSVSNALAQLPADCDVIAVHDAARPFWPLEHWDELAREAWKWDGAILAIPVADTLKRADPAGMVTVNRSDLWAAQTPQAFRAEMLRRAHTKAAEAGRDATDDADLVRHIGGAIKIVSSTTRNFKITTGVDWEMAEQLAGSSGVGGALRIGHGYDSHRLGGPGPLMLGGVRLADSGGLIGHSDGDAVLHALCDSLLGAAALGDIGKHFPPTNPEYKGCDSRDLLRQTRELLAAEGFAPNQVDITVLAEAPRLAPHIDAMRQVIATDLQIPLNTVSVKATTNEGMDAIGRGEGIAVHAVTAIRRISRGSR